MARCEKCGAGMRHYNQGNGFHAPVCPQCGHDPTDATEFSTSVSN